MSSHIDIVRIKAVHEALGDLQNEVVFVGGATVSLYADREAPESRPTEDVDILVEISSRWEFEALEEQLRKKGFQNDTTAKFLGRYLLPGFIVDVMPTDEKILGFSNKWYAEGFNTAVDYTIDEQCTVKIFESPYFIASKLWAFKNRGNNDGRTSSDFEDIVFVLENRQSIWQEMNNAKPDLKQYLHDEFTALYQNSYIEEWIGAHSSFFSPPSVYLIMTDIEAFVKNETIL